MFVQFAKYCPTNKDKDFNADGYVFGIVNLNDGRYFFIDITGQTIKDFNDPLPFRDTMYSKKGILTVGNAAAQGIDVIAR